MHIVPRRRTPAAGFSHTKWNCKYHIVFAPKYRRKEFFGAKREAIGRILRQLCEWKGVEIHEAEICPDHVHMLASIPPKAAGSSIMGYLKGKSRRMIYEQFGDLKYKYKGREFWLRGIASAPQYIRPLLQYQTPRSCSGLLISRRFFCLLFPDSCI